MAAMNSLSSISTHLKESINLDVVIEFVSEIFEKSEVEDSDEEMKISDPKERREKKAKTKLKNQVVACAYRCLGMVFRPQNICQ